MLQQIQQLIIAAQNDNDFYSLIHKNVSNNSSPNTYDKEKITLDKQQAELSCKVRKLFDNHANGIIDNRNYEMLMKDIQVKQTSLERKISSLQLRILDQHNSELYVTQFRNTVKELNKVIVLSPSILNKLIERIEISGLKASDSKSQNIIIIWRCNIN